MNYIIYDQLLLETTFNLEITEEILIANFMTMQVKQHGEPKDRKLPIYADESVITEQDYEMFWYYANEKTQQWF